MIIKPISINGETYKELVKIDKSKHEFDEDWLQKVIFENPQTYPIKNALAVDQKIISLGREIFCGTGFIDLLLLTSDAELIIVETKLWKNPEKTRTVLAQVIDYAKELVNWGYDDLNEAIINSQRNQDSTNVLSLDKIITKSFSYHDSRCFIDRLLENLQTGVLNLSVIGDKISPNLLLLSDSIQSSSKLNYNLTLVEMKLFRHNDEIILIPDIVGKTKEVIRGVIEVKYINEKPKVDMKYIETDKTGGSKGKTNKETFLSQCPEDIAISLETYLDKWQKNNKLYLYWGFKGMSIRRFIGDELFTLLDIYPNQISLITHKLAENAEVSDHILSNYKSAIFEIDGIESMYLLNKRYVKYESISTDDFILMLESVDKLIDELFD